MQTTDPRAAPFTAKTPSWTATTSNTNTSRPTSSENRELRYSKIRKGSGDLRQRRKGPQFFWTGRTAGIWPLCAPLPLNSTGVPIARVVKEITLTGNGSRMLRTIEVIKDADAQNPELVYLASDAVLDPLSTPMLARLRKQMEKRYQFGQPRFLCAKCEMPVHVSLVGSSTPQSRDGREAFFAHYPDGEFCEWRSSSLISTGFEEDNPRRGFEGITHYNLTTTLVRILKVDHEFNDVRLRPVISRLGGWRRPDVSANFGGQIIVFDFQINNTGLPEIVAREKFYSTHGIRHVWLLDGNNCQEFSRQPSQDIFWNNKCQALALDDESVKITFDQKKLHLSVWIVVPKLDKYGLAAKWEKKIVPREFIDWVPPEGGQIFRYPSFEIAAEGLVKSRFQASRLRLIKSLKGSDRGAEKQAATAWNEIASTVGAPLWNIARDDEAFRAFGVLASVAAAKKMDASRYPEDQLTAMFNNFLEHNRYRGWTAAFEQIASSYGHEDLLLRESTQRKIARNLGEHHFDFRLKYRAMLDIVFPRSALSRLIGVPSGT